MKITILLVALIVQIALIFIFWMSRSTYDEYRDQVMQQITQVIPLMNESPVDPEQFDVNDRGFWEGLGATKGHLFDVPLSNALTNFFKRENVHSVLDLGAGIGNYSNVFKQNGIFVSCYDGNPNTQQLTDGRCAIIDLSKPLDLTRHEWVMSLEVGEHIPEKFENDFIRNLNKLNEKGLIVSWAVEGQGGTAHVNCRNNDYIKAKFRDLGYINDLNVEQELRGHATFGWFKNTIMVFRKK